MEDVARLQNELLNLWKKTNEILEEKSIIAFAVGGTAIGALRDNGFIKWDDDFDIAIKEEDIDEFKDAISSSTLSMHDHSGINTWPFLRVHDKEIFIMSEGIKTNLFIDVFIAQKIRKTSRIKSLLFSLKRLKIRMVIAPKSFYKHKKYHIHIGFKTLWSFGMLIFRILPPYYNKKKISGVLVKDLLKWKIDSGFNHNIRQLYHNPNNLRMDISKFQKVKFEDYYLYVSSTFETDSLHMYGDIYKEPPLEKQIQKHDNYLC